MDTAAITASDEHPPLEELRRLGLALVLSAVAHFLAAQWLPQAIRPYERDRFAFSLTVTLAPESATRLKTPILEQPAETGLVPAKADTVNSEQVSPPLSPESIPEAKIASDNSPPVQESRGQQALLASRIARDVPSAGDLREQPLTPQASPEPHRAAEHSAEQPTELSTSTPEAPSHDSAVESEESAVPLLDYYYTSREVDQPARAIGDGLLQYPREALKLRIGGQVKLRLFIDEYGALNRADVVSASPPGTFEAAALEAVHSMRFSPARKGGQPVRSQRTVEIAFDPYPGALRNMPSSR